MSLRVIAHRGASEQYAEHTRAAYLQALAEGADGVECDVHLSADGQIVLLHDDDVDRTSSGSGPVAELTLEQLRILDFSSWKGADVPAEFGRPDQQLLTLPELVEVLLAAHREVELVIEFKFGAFFDRALIDATVAVLTEFGWSAEGSLAGSVRVSFMSFHPDAIKYLARTIPARSLCQLLELVEVEDVRAALDVGPLAGHTMAYFLRRAMAEGEELLNDGVAALAGPGVEYVRAHPEKVARWVAAGRTLRVWTVNTAEELAVCRAAGVSEFTSNRPAALRALL